ncbi:MAG: HAD-IB family phosphatase [Thermoplasmata archaeon]|nr:MAG: HAD-IB family phosphatase [Thermoplasmata archaeon]
MNGDLELAVFDMDGVLVDSRSSWVLVHDHFGTQNEDSLRAFLRREIDDQEFIRRDVERWESSGGRVHVDEVREVLDRAPIINGAMETLVALREAGVRTAIVSGGLRYLALRIQETADVDFVLANDVEVDDEGYLTGRGVVQVPLLEKGEVVAGIQGRMGIGPGVTAAVGDSRVDATMFSHARIAVAFNPRDETVVRSATHVVESGDLRAVLPLLLGDGS